MNITETELKKIIEKHLKSAADSKFHITKNRKKIVKLTNSNRYKHKVLDSLIGIIPGDTTLEQIKNDRLKKQ